MSNGYELLVIKKNGLVVQKVKRNMCQVIRDLAAEYGEVLDEDVTDPGELVDYFFEKIDNMGVEIELY